MLTITFVRHGESLDNLRTVWAGWADAPLSNHGMNQAKAAGEYFSSTKFDAVYASTLKRAHSTAQAIYDVQSEPKPPFTTSPDLREQHFGIAEGKPWSLKGDESLSREELYARGIYPVIHNREDRFPEGESLDDLQVRAERAIEEHVMPNVWGMAKGGKDLHIAVVSHGLCISELIAAALRRDKDAASGGAEKRWTGLMNTAWTRVTVEIPSLKSGETAEVNPDDLPPLVVNVTHVNQHSHLDKVKRQKGGIGSSAYDPKQKDIRAFFGGATANADSEVSSSGTAVQVDAHLEEGRAASNAFDETEPASESRL